MVRQALNQRTHADPYEIDILYFFRRIHLFDHFAVVQYSLVEGDHTRIFQKEFFTNRHLKPRLKFFKYVHNLLITHLFGLPKVLVLSPFDQVPLDVVDSFLHRILYLRGELAYFIAVYDVIEVRVQVGFVLAFGFDWLALFACAAHPTWKIVCT
jgi:hypothetical protein